MRDSSAATGDGWLCERVAPAPYWAAGRDDFSCWGGHGRARAPELKTHWMECGVCRAIAAPGILAPQVERPCASKKGGRTAHSANVSDGVGGPRRAYSASGYRRPNRRPLSTLVSQGVIPPGSPLIERLCRAGKLARSRPSSALMQRACGRAVTREVGKCEKFKLRVKRFAEPRSLLILSSAGAQRHVDDGP